MSNLENPRQIGNGTAIPHKTPPNAMTSENATERTHIAGDGPARPPQADRHHCGHIIGRQRVSKPPQIRPQCRRPMGERWLRTGGPQPQHYRDDWEFSLPRRRHDRISNAAGYAESRSPR